MRPLEHNIKPVFVHERGGLDEAEACESNVIFLLRANNGSYAAGNNAGLRLALRLGAEYVWILNNDALVEPEAARHLVDQMRRDPRLGLCGTTLRSYDNPEQIQILGGWHYSRWIARPTPLLTPSKSRRCLSYVAGASVCVSRGFLEKVGLLCEDYVLYGEEMDWAARAGSRFSLSYCPEAVVYHKGAGTIARSLSDAQQEYYATRARLLLTRKFWPLLLLTVWLSMLGRVVLRLFQARLGAARSIMLAVAGKPLGKEFWETTQSSSLLGSTKS